MTHPHRSKIDIFWENQQSLDMETARPILESVLLDLGTGAIRVCDFDGARWHTHEWIKKAILLSFRVFPSVVRPGGYDKIPLKTDGWMVQDFESAGFRMAPGAIVRQGAYVAPGAILMPSFINIGAHVGAGTLVDTWATVGSCAQIGNNCHLSGGVGIGGVLEPLGAHPVIIEDNCFIGARSEIVEGVRICTGAVLGMGVFIGASTPIVNRQTGEITRGTVPPHAVVLSGTLPSKPMENGEPGPHLPCAVIVKQVDARTRSKTAINDLLRVL